MFAPDVSRALLRQQTRLDVLRPHAVDHEPREGVAQTSSVSLAVCARVSQLLELGRSRRGASAFTRRRRRRDELGDFRDDQEREPLAPSDLSHAPGTLRVVAEGHVLAEGERGGGAGSLPDVHPRRVNLIVKGEPLTRVERRQPGERYHVPALAQQHHLAIAFIEEHAPFRPCQALVQHEPRHREVRKAGDQRADVDESVNRRVRRRDRPQQRTDVPVPAQVPRGHHVHVRQGG